MGYRNKTIQLLYTILEKNHQDGKLYYTASQRCKRLFYKSFFRKLAVEKSSFCKRIKYEIEVLENEIISMGGEIDANFNQKEASVIVLPVFRTEKDGLIKECYRREKQNIKMYNRLLTRISIGEIREMLLYQRHSLRQIYQEIESLGLKICDDYDEKISKKASSEGERNFGETQFGL